MELNTLSPMKLHELIRAKRVELGLSDSHVAEQVGLPIMWLYDVEVHESEYHDNLDIGILHRICSVVGINFYSVVADYCDREPVIYVPSYY
jgi:hypothetical protein